MVGHEGESSNQSSFAKASQDTLRSQSKTTAKPPEARASERRVVGHDDNCLNPELAEFRAWDQVFGVLQDWNRSLVAHEPPKDGP